MNATILVIEDDEAHRRVCRLALQGAGYNVVTAGDGAEGLRLLAQHAVDVVLTDILMPNVEGVETIVTLRRQHPDVRVIAMSGGGTVSAEECLALSRTLGASAVLRKPFTVDELVQAVSEALPRTPR